MALVPEAPVEAVEVYATVPEAPVVAVFQVEVSGAVVLEPEALEPGSLEVCLSVVVGLPLLVPNPQRKRP